VTEGCLVIRVTAAQAAAAVAKSGISGFLHSKLVRPLIFQNIVDKSTNKETTKLDLSTNLDTPPQLVDNLVDVHYCAYSLFSFSHGEDANSIFYYF